MIKYFKELENPNNFKLYVMPHDNFKHSKLSIKFRLKYYTLLREALSNLSESTSLKNYEEIVLPNAWYILPEFKEIESCLFNTGSEIGHKETKLKIPFKYALDEVQMDPKFFYTKANKLKKDYDYMNNYIKNTEFIKNLHIKNNMIVALGNIVAEGLLWEYFEELRKKVRYYPDALKELKEMILDDFLIRCVGFHKVISVEEKIISTSDINYQEDFYDYINNGWFIDFVKPLVWNNGKKDFVEINNDLVKIKQFHN